MYSSYFHFNRFLESSLLGSVIESLSDKKVQPLSRKGTRPNSRDFAAANVIRSGQYIPTTQNNSLPAAASPQAPPHIPDVFDIEK
jgi:hypothetical protein